jgi:hypothetical protein
MPDNASAAASAPDGSPPAGTVQPEAGEKAAATVDVAARIPDEGADVAGEQPDDKSGREIVDVGTRKRPPRRQKKYWTSVALLIAFAGLSAGALALYKSSSPAELATPSYTIMVLQSNVPLGIIGYSVTQYSDTADIVISVKVSTAAPRGETPQAKLQLTPPDTNAYLKCPNGATCGALLPSTGLTRQWQLTFAPDASGVETAHISYPPVQAQAFGDVSNGLNAAAVMPQVLYQCSCSNTPLLQVQYNLAGAGSYDWSSFPFQEAGATSATWDEPVVANGETQGRVALGVDGPTQDRDNAFLFLAGALIGTAGAALVGAITEAFRTER